MAVMRLGPVVLSRTLLGLLVLRGLCVLTPIARADLWTTAYYAGWNQGYLPPTNIDFTALSHIIHFSLVPKPDGSLDASANTVTPAYSADLVSRAHAAGKKVLICVGGADSQAGFLGATTNANLPTFINNLVNFMSAYNYDGVDVDWEPLLAADANQFTNLVNGLRSALNGFSAHKLLTVAAAAYPDYRDPPTAQYTMFGSLQGQFDQINIMTYDLAGPYPGWVTWFNAPIYDGGYHFPSTGGLILSADGAVSNFIANGVASGKLAIGIAFYGVIWAGGAGTATGGASLPRQSWTTAPTVNQITYSGLMSIYYQSNLYHWDSAAQAAYLSIENSGSANDKFISYDDEHACQAKISYARNRHLGGVMIWELGSAYRATQPNGQRDSLLQSVKQSLATPGQISIRRTGQDIHLTFATLPLGLYRVQWTSNLTTGAWNTLTNNLPGTNGPVEVTDPAAIPSQSSRFYRVQTPP